MPERVSPVSSDTVLLTSNSEDHIARPDARCPPRPRIPGHHRPRSVPRTGAPGSSVMADRQPVPPRLASSPPADARTLQRHDGFASSCPASLSARADASPARRGARVPRSAHRMTEFEADVAYHLPRRLVHEHRRRGACSPPSPATPRVPSRDACVSPPRPRRSTSPSPSPRIAARRARASRLVLSRAMSTRATPPPREAMSAPSPRVEAP